MSANLPSTAPLPAVPAHWENAVALRPQPPAAGGRLRGWVARVGLRMLMAAYGAAMGLARRKPRPASPPFQVVVTMTTHSDSWARAHLAPLARASRCAGVIAVTAAPLRPIEGVTVICPPAWLRRSLGEVAARLLTFVYVGLTKRPDLIGGFHLQMNGLAAALVARLTGARSIYFCVGGPREVVDGGVWSENRLFGRLPGPDATLERDLLSAVRSTDLVITMGSRALSYFDPHGLSGRCHVIPGGIDRRIFNPADSTPDLDVVFVGRLAPIKRVDLFLRSMRHVADAVPTLKVAIVGEGPLREDLCALARELGLEPHVVFAGHQQNVAAWLRRARIFMLTSESEGLALSLMEAMACGVAPVVADVGDLGDMVREGENGYLVSGRTAEAFAAPAIALLKDPARLARIRAAAAHTAEAYTVETTTRRWEAVL